MRPYDKNHCTQGKKGRPKLSINSAPNEGSLHAYYWTIFPCAYFIYCVSWRPSIFAQTFPYITSVMPNFNVHRSSLPRIHSDKKVTCLYIVHACIGRFRGWPQSSNSNALLCPRSSMNTRPLQEFGNRKCWCSLGYGQGYRILVKHLLKSKNSTCSNIPVFNFCLGENLEIRKHFIQWSYKSTYSIFHVYTTSMNMNFKTICFINDLFFRDLGESRWFPRDKETFFPQKIFGMLSMISMLSNGQPIFS